MEVHTPVMDHPKKRRRRRKVDRIPLSATLIPDTNLKGEVGILSVRLFERLFLPTGPCGKRSANPEAHYIAVSPWAPQSPDVYRDRAWTILPVKAPKSEEQDEETRDALLVRYPASSSAIWFVFGDVGNSSATKTYVGGKYGAPILVLDVEPARLASVYVIVDGNALARHEQIQKEFGGGFGSFRKNNQSKKGKGRATSSDRTDGASEEFTRQRQEDELTAAVRSALGLSAIVRQGDSLPLPLPAHPITHVPLPPAKIVLCEPVNQGLLSPDTQIVVDRHIGSSKNSPRRLNRQIWSAQQQPTVENEEDTSNEDFYSAVEDGVNGHVSLDNAEEEISSANSSEDDGSSGSEESTDDIISLSTPGLPTQPISNLSSVAATPRPKNTLFDGTSTPSSVFSNFIATTARQNSGIAKGFQACCLLAPVPDDLLHPKPDATEDVEARIYVDIKDLLRLKCFSGDWVKIRAIHHQHDQQAEDWTMSAYHMAGTDDHDGDFRVVKVYGLSGVSPRRIPRYPLENKLSLERRSSVIDCSHHEHPMSQSWLSPILFANLNSPPKVRITPLLQDEVAKRPFSPKTGPSKSAHNRYPPVAVEVSLAKISTPRSQEAAMQESLFSRLKQYFESRRRIVKTGDLIALTVNVTLGTLLGLSKSAAESDKQTEEFWSFIQHSPRPDNRSLDVIWFRVGHISTRSPGKEAGDHSESIWGGAACVVPATTRMTMGTSHQCKIPSTSSSAWKSYLGLVLRSPVGTSTGPLGSYMSMTPRPYVSTLYRRLRELIAAGTSPRAAHLGLAPMLILLHSNQRNIGKATAATRAASYLGVHTFAIEGYDIVTEGNAGDVQESSINTRMARGLSCGAQYTAFLIRHLEALTSNRMVSALEKAVKSLRVLIATTSQLDQLPENLRSLFTHEIQMSAPDESEREGILRNIIEEQGIRTAHDVDLAAIAVKTAALVAGNLVDIVERACIARQERLDELIKSTAAANGHTQNIIRDLVVSGGEWACCVIKADFDLAVDAARKNFADAIGAPKIPNVSWDDVGGLEHVKDAVMETIQLPLERPELFAKGMKKRSGILFYGPPGTGKTLLAKAIATEFSLNFFSVKGPELLNMYIGESEANVRRVFQRARDARPCVVFFDELDSVAPKRGNQGDSGGVMDRIVSQLLAELDGMSDGEDGGGGVFVIGATNRPDLLDQALLRPGRFDKMLYLGISDTHQKQKTILEALTRKFSLDPGLSLARVAESLPFTYTGADLYALCSDAMLKAITRQASAVDAKIKALRNGPVTHAYFFDHLATKEDIAVTVLEEDFQAARRELVGSVSAKELEHYQRVRQSFEAPSKPPPNGPAQRNLPQQQPMPTRPKPSTRMNTAIKTQPKPSTDHKGKGKARQPSDSDEDDDDDDAYVTSNDFAEKTPDKGKGKQRATMIPKPLLKAEYKQLGKSGLRVSVPIFGAMSFGDKRWQPWIIDEAEALPLLKAAFERGLNTWDTANVYSNGVSEEIIGKAIKNYNIPRHKLVILTKCCGTVRENNEPETLALKDIDQTVDYVNQRGLSRQGIFSAVEASLQRLDTPYIDLLQIHRFDKTVPVEETMEALHDLVKSGKVRYIGASSMWTYQFATMQFAAERRGWTKFISMQNYYNLLYREEEREMNRFCNETGVGLIPWSPLAQGSLARTVSAHGSTARSEGKSHSDVDAQIIGRVEELAKKRDWKMSQVALAWVNKRIASPIIGFSKVERMDEALEVKGKELTEEEEEYLEELYQPQAVRGHS
ncbi:MAG: hypothetical protein Q9218_003827 [Villophora microphyllina]